MSKVLIIEDDQMIAKSIENRIKSKIPRCQVTMAADFYVANSELVKNSFDLIVSDLQMPSKGLSACDGMKGTTLNGWRFLRQSIENDSLNCASLLEKKRIVIFSAYIDSLISYGEMCPNDKKYIDQLILVYKSQFYANKGGYDVLVEKIEKIIELL